MQNVWFLGVVGVAMTCAVSACSASGGGVASPVTSPTSPARPATAPAEPGKSSSPRMTGRLPPPLIQSIVRGHYPQIQDCYGRGLGRDPQLKGRITVRFVIERNGSVRRARIDDSALQDAEVLRCIVAEFDQLRFPEPDGGIITVVYPLMLSPADR